MFGLCLNPFAPESERPTPLEEGRAFRSSFLACAKLARAKDYGISVRVTVKSPAPYAKYVSMKMNTLSPALRLLTV